MPSAAALLTAYDTQLRARVPVPAPAGTSYEPDGPIMRSYGAARGFIDYRDLGGLRGAELDAFIARQRDFFAARHEAVVVCAAWTRYAAGTDFAMLWGGSTVPEQRGRGLYRALVAHRARRAAERGVHYLEVDASDDSRPILRRLGFTAVTTTTPYVWTPPVTA